MDIIKMNQFHVTEIAKLEKACFSAPWSEKSINSELSNPLSHWLVAMIGNSVAGYIGSQSVLGEADMMNVAVAPQFRNSGVAQALILQLIEDLREQRVTCLTLEVRPSNTAAVRLYEKLGFALVGVRPHYYSSPKEDALILRKEWQL